MKMHKRGAPKTKDPFVKVPLWWAKAAAKATRAPDVLVWVWLLYKFWDGHGQPVPMANAKLKRWGVSREIKRRVLRDLENAGLITVERLPRKTPTVTIILL